MQEDHAKITKEFAETKAAAEEATKELSKLKYVKVSLEGGIELEGAEAIGRLLEMFKFNFKRIKERLDKVEESAGRLEHWIEAEQPSPSEPAVRDEQLDILARFLAELPEDQQEVLVLKHCLGRKVAEIAEETGRSVASVAGLLRRGLKRLRELFPEE